MYVQLKLFGPTLYTAYGIIFFIFFFNFQLNTNHLLRGKFEWWKGKLFPNNEIGLLFSIGDWGACRW